MTEKEKLKEAVSQIFGIEFEQIISRSRVTELVYARFIYTYFRHISGVSVSEIAREINRTRSTTVHNIRKYGEEYQTNRRFKQIAEQVKLVACV